MPVVGLEPLDERARTCPECGVSATRMKEWVTASPRDLPVGDRTCRLRRRKRRWHCDQRECPRRPFTEQVEQLPAQSRVASDAAVTAVRRWPMAAGRACGPRAITACPARLSRLRSAYAARVLPDEPEPVAVLGIDETRRSRPRWSFDEQAQAWQAVADRWHVSLVDLSRGQGLLGQVEGRTSQVVIDWLDARGQEWKPAGQPWGHRQVRDLQGGCARRVAARRSGCGSLPHRSARQRRAPRGPPPVTVQVRGRRGRKGNRERELRNPLTRSAARMHGLPTRPDD